MNKISIISFVIAVMLIAVPASAVTSESLMIDVGTGGDTTVTFDYSLNWLENFAVFLKIGDPASELKKGLEGYSDKEVEVTSVSNGKAAFIVYGFAHVTESNDSVTYRTPVLNFTDAEKVLKGYWFAPLISVDLSPAETTVRFPDSYEKKFYNTIEIPSITHKIMK
ncbi:MAG: hypothetical protein U9N40_03755 [Euryarchaeota archaeon]|nr:hypothetical protein [Euryarchaeota archaeon]